MSWSSAGPSWRYSGTGTNPLDRVDADTRFTVSVRSTGRCRNLPEGMQPSSREAWAWWMEAFAAFWRLGVKALGDHVRFALPPPVRPRTPRSAGTQHPHIAMGLPHRTEHRCVSPRTSPPRFQTVAALASPASYPPRACLGHDPGRLLAEVGDRLQDVPATLAFELMDPAHPIVDGVLDERVRAADGAIGFGRDHARSIGVSRSSAHRPFG